MTALNWSKRLQVGRVAIAALILGGLVSLHAAASIAQSRSDAPVTGFQQPGQSSAEFYKREADLAARRAIEQLNQLGPRYGALTSVLQRLPSSTVIERLALKAPVGPSAIATSPVTPRAPAAAVNYPGEDGLIAAAPAIVMILAQWGDADDFAPQCSGTLVRPDLVLTASHCFCAPTEQYPTLEICRKGTTVTAVSNLQDHSRVKVFFQHLGVRDVVAILQPDDYRFEKTIVRADFALLKLKDPVDWIIPAELTRSQRMTVGRTSAYYAGFGYSTSQGATDLSELQRPGLKVKAPAQFASCSGMSWLAASSAYCSTYRGARAATICEGDSGGPLWTEASDGTGHDSALQIGVASGRDNANCAVSNTSSFEMNLGYPDYSTWLNAQILASSAGVLHPLWPPFADNLRNVLVRRGKAFFGADGHYAPETLALQPEDGPIIATMNSPGAIRSFSVVDRATNLALCIGRGGASNHIPNADYCIVKNVKASTQIRIVADGEAHAPLQFIISRFDAGTEFPD